MGNKILLVDDSVTVQKIITLTFSDEGVDVVTVDSGDEAISRLAYLRPALVMADVSIPGRNGYDVCAFIKGNPELKNIPVVLLVPGFETYDAERARRVGADYHLTKPFQSIRSLITTVKSLMGVAAGTGASSGMLTDDNLLELDPADTSQLAAAPAAIAIDSLGLESIGAPSLSPIPAGADDQEGRPDSGIAPEPGSPSLLPLEQSQQAMSQQVMEEMAEKIAAKLAAGIAARVEEMITEKVASRVADQLREESARTRQELAETLELAATRMVERMVGEFTGRVGEILSRQIADGFGQVPATTLRPAAALSHRNDESDHLLELDDL